MHYTFKISLIGTEHVGKTSLIIRYLKNTFNTKYQATLGADFIDKDYASSDLDELENGEELTVTFWDMAGQAHFKEIANIYLEGSKGVILVFDVNEPDSFKDLSYWKSLIDSTCPEATILIVGNKNDLEKKISDERIKEIEEQFGVPIIWTSAKMNENVKNMFEKIVKDVLRKNISSK